MNEWVNSFISLSDHLHDPSLMGLFRQINQQQTKHSDLHTYHCLTAQYIVIELHKFKQPAYNVPGDIQQ